MSVEPRPRKLVRTERKGVATYLVYDDGHVVAYGRERGENVFDPPVSPPRWIASVWKGHPYDDAANAVHVEHLAADSEWRDFQAALTSWEKGER